MEIFGCEMDIIKYINEYDRKDYESILANDTRWEIFYNFSEMRKSILNWYDFKSDAKLLEIGGEYGALTGLFCENVKHVVCYESSELHCDAIKKRYSDIDNLEVTNDFEKALNGQYDYIVIIGGLERSVAGKGEEAEYVDFLKKIGNSLCEEGTLLLAVENRLGVKYFCGYKERYTNVPFAGINGYNCLTNGYTFSRAEIRNIIEKAKIGEYRFYYPLPDYKLTQLVYTDDNLPNNSIRDKVINYYVDKSTLVSCEDNLYDDIIANNALPFMANSFLIEISKNNTLSNVSYAALSTDRKKSEALATIIYGKERVCKKALYTVATHTIHSLYDNIHEINLHGVNTVPHILKDESHIEMPYIKAKSLMCCIQDSIKNSREEVLRLLDLLYDNILASSDYANSEDNYLLKYCDKQYDFGIILKHAYIDMIPYNCFLIDNKLVFYDQEFRRDNYPAKYIMYRAIWYMYNFLKDMEKYISLEELKERYGLSEIWYICQRAEDEFIEDNRNHNVMKSFYNWLIIDKSIFYKQ